MSTGGEHTRPLPAPDEQTRGFWSAARRHELAFQQCDRCGRYAHPPVAFCRGCHDLDRPSFSFTRVGGSGTVVSWTVIVDHMVGGFHGAGPLVHVLVAMDGESDLLFAATLIGDHTGLAPGAEVDVVFQDVTPEVTLPCFRLRHVDPQDDGSGDAQAV